MNLSIWAGYVDIHTVDIPMESWQALSLTNKDFAQGSASPTCHFRLSVLPLEPYFSLFRKDVASGKNLLHFYYLPQGKEVRCNGKWTCRGENWQNMGLYIINVLSSKRKLKTEIHNYWIWGLLNFHTLFSPGHSCLALIEGTGAMHTISREGNWLLLVW